MKRLVLAAALALSAASSCVDWNSPFVDEALRVSDPAMETAILDSAPAPSEPESGPLRTLFERINSDRAAEGLLPVVWDPGAAALAADYTRRQILEDTLGHFLIDGIPPYARASRRGIFGLGSENAAAFTSVNGVIEETTTNLLLHAEDEMIREKPPNDGHRKAILDPAATHVGIGWHQSPTEFRMVEEFFCRKFTRLSIAPTGLGAAVVFRGTPGKGEELEYVTVAREPIPKHLSRPELLRRRSYSYPSPKRTITAANSTISYGGLKSERLLTISFDRRFALHYDMNEPGLWTFVFYFRRDGSGSPPKPGGSISVTVAPLPRKA